MIQIQKMAHNDLFRNRDRTDHIRDQCLSKIEDELNFKFYTILMKYSIEAMNEHMRRENDPVSFDHNYLDT